MHKRLTCCFLLACAATLSAAHADDGAADPPGRVAMFSVVDGQVLVQPAGSSDWIADVQNRPLGTGDKVWVDRRARAELSVGSATVDLSGSTGMEFLVLDDYRLQLRVSAGTLRLNARRLDAGRSIELDTPGGAVTVRRPGVYRLDVADGVDDVRVGVWRGQAEVATAQQSTLLEAGQLGEFSAAGDAQTTSLLPADDFDRWADGRERRDERAVAARYVSREIPGYADLDDWGDWVNDPAYGAVWLPRVAADFVPYRDGRWAWVAPWGWTWIDGAPWGFVPFHYGRWARVGGRWGWCPGPVGQRGYYAPALVAWLGGSAWNSAYAGRGRVGWFPLGWNEVYLPGYRASAAYARELNLANTQLTRTYLNNNLVTDNYRSASMTASPSRYANQQVPGAVTVVPLETLTSSNPVAAIARGAGGGDFGHLPAQAAPPAAPATPARNSGGVVTHAPANASLWQRPVYARTVPAHAPGAGTTALRVVGIRVRAPEPAHPTVAPAAAVARAYADRPPYVQRPAASGTEHPFAAPAQRQQADRPWSERAAGAGAYRAPAPDPHPAAPARTAPAPHPGAPAHPQHMRAPPHPALLPRHVATAYHAPAHGHTRLYAR